MTDKHSAIPLRQQFDFRADILDNLISGQSSIDNASGLHIRNSEEARHFIHAYGYNLDNPIEKAELQGNFREALNFIRKHFLQPDNPEGFKLEIPRKIMDMDDVSSLLLMASNHFPGQTSGTQGNLLRNWACAILKVMHTVAHVDKDLRSPYFTDIQVQILDRFYKVIHRNDAGQLFLGDSHGPNHISLVAFETKPKKSRDSIVMKLLHKPENVAEDIFDRVGIRFITHTPLDSLRVVKFLRDKMLVIPANIKPSRSRNTLVDVSHFKQQLSTLLEQVEKGEITEEVFRKQLEDAARPPQGSTVNPHTSKDYRSIQFTCRQLIKLRNPLFDQVRELKTLAKSNPALSEVGKNLEKLDLAQVQKEIRFFYPFEVQVFDKVAAEENERGRSAHGSYKKSQAQTAMRRVMNSLVGDA